jgi:hypothetical protein
MTAVQIGPENTFGFIDNKTALAKLKLPDINLVPNFIETNMTNKEFFERITDVNDGIIPDFVFLIFLIITITGTVKSKVT